MPTESEIKTARYTQTEKEADDFGRIIFVRRLKPSEQTRLAGMTGELSGSDEVMLEDPETKQLRMVSIRHRDPLILAASVCKISDEQGEYPVAFPKDRAALDAILDRLDGEGLLAAGKALQRLNESELSPINTVAAAKN
jgi:hypothetical protein